MSLRRRCDHPQQDQGRRGGGKGGYALLSRELNGNANYTLDLEPIFGSRPLKVEGVIGGRGEAVLEGATLRVKILEKLDFIWVKLGV